MGQSNETMSNEETMKNSAQKELLLTGLACRFPESPSTQSFWENLVAGVDMVSKNDEHWPQARNCLRDVKE